KVESLLAAMASLRVEDGEKGFVAENVRDFTPYGLAPPAASVELLTGPAGELHVLHVGKPVLGNSDRVYVRREDQDDVVTVGAKALGEIPENDVALRSQHISDIEPALASEIQVQMGAKMFSLKKNSSGWQLVAPREERADQPVVTALLSEISTLQTSEFLDA